MHAFSPFVRASSYSIAPPFCYRGRSLLQPLFKFFSVFLQELPCRAYCCCLAGLTPIAWQHLIIPSAFEGTLVTAIVERCSLISSNERSQSFRFCVSAIQMKSADPLAGKCLLQNQCALLYNDSGCAGDSASAA